MKKYLFISIVFMGFVFGGYTFAQDLQIIPEGNEKTVGDAVTAVGKDGGHVWENYNKQASSLQSKNDLGAQMASGIFTWDTILDYLVYLVKFLSQLGIFIGAAMILYAGYLYATSIFNAKGTSAGNTAIKNAIIGVLVITFSYAIMRAITAAFLN